MFISAYMHKTMITTMRFWVDGIFGIFFFGGQGVLGSIFFRYPRCMPFLYAVLGILYSIFGGVGVVDGVVDICFSGCGCV